MDYSSVCSCQSVKIELSLPNSIEHYSPRECDCDFCQQHKLAYISDKDGKLSISSKVVLNCLKQGSEQASFIQCSECGEVVAVTYKTATALKGAVSATLFARQYTLGQYQSASPKLLDAQEKRERWATLWMSAVIEKSGDTH